MTKINFNPPFSCFQKLVIILLLSCVSENIAAQQIRVVIAGLNHDHVHGILNQFNKGLVNVAGIVEPNKELQVKYSKLYHLPDSLFFNDLKKLIIQKKPDAVLGYNAAGRHLGIVEICAPLGITVMVEKPLAATLLQAKQIELLALKYHIKVLTNYETTWYPPYRDVFNTVAKGEIGPKKKMGRREGDFQAARVELTVL